MEVRKIPIEQLMPAKYNPRKDLKPGDPEYEKLARSMAEFGYVEPIIWNERTGNIVGGHQRFKVLKSQGVDSVECVVVDMDEAKEKTLNIALNKISGDWNNEALSSLFFDLNTLGINLLNTGFDEKEINDLLHPVASIADDDFVVGAALPETPVSQLGDLWLLGKHRLMCGDSTSAEAVQRLMDGGKARMVFTDPPWNVDYGHSENPRWKSGTDRQILNDKMSTEAFGAFLLQAFTCMREVSEPGCMTYVVMSAQEWGNLMQVMASLGYHWSSTIIWVKDSLVLSRKDYHTQYEPLWYGWLEGTRCCPLKDRKQSDVWEIPRPKVSLEHPTMKPVPLVAKALVNSSKYGDTVLDLFGGSGTTLIAAEQTGRECRMMELDPKYCDVIIARWENLTGKKAVRENV